MRYAGMQGEEHSRCCFFENKWVHMHVCMQAREKERGGKKRERKAGRTGAALEEDGAGHLEGPEQAVEVLGRGGGGQDEAGW